MKKIIYIIALLLLTVSCTKDFEDINTNKNKPETIVPDLLLTYLIYHSVDVGVQGSVVMQHLAARDWVVGLGRYDWWGTPYWDYSTLRNVNNLNCLSPISKLVYDLIISHRRCCYGLLHQSIK